MLLAISSAYAEDKYIIDPTHSTIGFGATHMEVSVIRGEFTDYKGEILFDKDNINNLRGQIVIKAKSIDTRLEARDKHLRNADFFDVEIYPTILFKVKKLLKKDNGYEIIGDLTMHGVTRKVSGPVTIRGPVKTSFGTEIIGISGETIINRHDYDISWNAEMPGGGFAVGNDVEIIIDIEAYKTTKHP
jgi:polyisoprenoid-binding protein YceI